MHFGGKLSSGKPQFLTKRAVVVFFLSAAFAFGGACSKGEEQENPKPKVIIPIKKPTKERHRIPLAPKASTVKSEEFVLELPQMAALEKDEPNPPSPAKESKEQAPVMEEKGYYTVQKGDNLAKIAARSDVYGDPIKWPSLFRLNMDELGSMKVAEAFDMQWSSLFKLKTDTVEGTKVLGAFEQESLPEGLRLRFLTEEEIRENRTNLVQKNWAVNVLSSQNKEGLVPSAIVLMKNGHPVYISEAMVKGQKWMRLRVGFFATRSEAMAIGKELMSILNADETWITEVAQSEVEEFGGY